MSIIVYIYIYTYIHIYSKCIIDFATFSAAGRALVLRRAPLRAAALIQ